MRSTSHRDAVFVAFRVCTRFLLFAPWFFHFTTPIRGLRATVLSIESLACRLAFAGTAAVVGVLLERTELVWAIGAAVALGLAPVLVGALLPATLSRKNQRGAGT